MHFVGQSLWGMHVFWWLFWFLTIMVLFSPITPLSTGRGRETPLERLQHRYAAGDISTAEYEERKANLI